MGVSKFGIYACWVRAKRYSRIQTVVPASGLRSCELQLPAMKDALPLGVSDGVGDVFLGAFFAVVAAHVGGMLLGFS